MTSLIGRTVQEVIRLSKAHMETIFAAAAAAMLRLDTSCLTNQS